MRIALAGSRGFIGRAVVRSAQQVDVAVVALPAIRVDDANGVEVPEAAQRWIRGNTAIFSELVGGLDGVDVVVNAAGLAEPESRDSRALEAANAVLPVVVASAAVRAGVAKMVQISTAAVQGRRAVLDETLEVEPVSAYGRSKALAEAALVEQRADVPDEVVIYRPTSVQGVDRAMTQRLVAAADRSLVPICGSGDVPLPVALIDNVAAGIVHVCRSSSHPPVVLQPWEGLTTRSLLTALGARRLVAVPWIIVRGLLGAARIASASSRLAAQTRRLELLAFGQGQAANALSTLGFTPAGGVEGYAQLGRDVRAARHQPRRAKSARSRTQHEDGPSD